MKKSPLAPAGIIGRMDVAARRLAFLFVVVGWCGVAAVSHAADTTPPTVSNFVGDSGMYSEGRFTLIFNEAVTGVAPGIFTASGADGVTVTGPATVSTTGTDGTTYRIFVPISGSAGNVNLAFNGSAATSVKDLAGNAFAGSTLTATSRIQIGVLSVIPPGAANYTTGMNLDFTVNLSGPVTVTGVPSLPIDIGTPAQHVTRQATYRSGSGTSSLLFRYTVQSTDSDTDGIAISSFLFNGGSINSTTAGSPANMLYGTPNTSQVLINATPPAPKIAVVYAGTAISAGDPTPSTIDGTDFGSLTIGGGGAIGHNFTIQNTGNAPLTINTPITVAGGSATDFSLGGAAMAATPYSIAPGASVSLNVTFQATGAGIRYSGVTIPNNDNGFFSFAIQGTGIDRTAPAIRSFSVGAPNTAARTVTFNLEFDEAVSGVTANSVSLSTTGGATGAITSVTTPITPPYPTHTITVTYGGTAGGTITLAVKSTGSGIVDGSGNAYAGAGTPTSATFTVPAVPTNDTTPPTVVSFAPGTPTRGEFASFLLEFSEPVSGVDVGDFEASFTGSTIARVTSVSTSASLPGAPVPPGQRYEVVVQWDGQPGSFRATLKGSGTGIVDASGNAYAGGAVTSSPITLTDGSIVIAGSQSATGTQNAPFSYQILGSGVMAYTLNFLSAPLPAGLTLNSLTGVISGTPTVAGTTTVGIRATNPGGSANGNVVITINPPSVVAAAPVITSPLTASVASGAAFSYTIAASNSPTSFTATNLPSGLTFSAPTITGTVAAAGTYNITIGAANGAGGDTKTLVLTVTAAPTTTKGAQTISFNSPVSAITIGQPIALGATSSAGLPLTYAIVSGDATLEGNVLTPRSTATLVVRASSAGNETTEAASVEVNFGNPQKAAQTIAVAVIGDTTVAAGPFALPATTSAGLPISYAVSGPARLEGNTLILSGAAGTVTLRATAAGNDSFAPAAEVVRTFAVRAIGQQVYLGSMNSDTFGAALTTDTTKGVLVLRLGSSGEAVIGRFTVNPDGTFSTQATSSTNATRTLRGSVANGVLSGSIAELGASFVANVQPATGATADLAGLYLASIPGSASGDTYLVVGAGGQAYAVAVTPFAVTSGTGTIASSGEFSITTGDGGSIAGNLNASDGTLRGTLRSGATTAALAGLSQDAARSDRLINLSSRLRTSGEAARAMIAGFVVAGTESKPMLIRAVGPSLGAFGVQDALQNPRLQVYNNVGVLVAENEDWGNNADVAAAAERVGAFKLDGASRDAVVLATLPPGAYTAQVATNGGAGVALLEVYDASSAGAAAAAPQLINISTRGFVDTGDGNLIAGFVVVGNAPKRVLIRGIGPSLTGFGVTGAVANPTLKLYAAGSTTAIGQNDDWGTAQPINASQAAATAAEITAAGTAAGAFPLTANSRDAAIVITLMPGAYTAVVSDAANGTGAGLIEVYQLGAQP